MSQVMLLSNSQIRTLRHAYSWHQHVVYPGQLAWLKSIANAACNVAYVVECILNFLFMHYILPLVLPGVPNALQLFHLDNLKIGFQFQSSKLFWQNRFFCCMQSSFKLLSQYSSTPTWNSHKDRQHECGSMMETLPVLQIIIRFYCSFALNWILLSYSVLLGGGGGGGISDSMLILSAV